MGPLIRGEAQGLGFEVDEELVPLPPPPSFGWRVPGGLPGEIWGGDLGPVQDPENWGHSFCIYSLP